MRNPLDPVQISYTEEPAGFFSQPGGRILNQRNPRSRPVKIVTIGAVTALGLLLLGGVAVFVPGSTVLDPENGQGGPNEAPLTASLLPASGFDLIRGPVAGDFRQDLLAGAYYRRDLQQGPAQAQTGPLDPLDRIDPLGQGPQVLRIPPRQTFYDALAGRGIAHQDIMDLVTACKPFRNLSKVRSGEVFRIQIDPDGRLLSLGFDLDVESHVTWVRDGDTYLRQDGTYPVQRRLRGVAGEIDRSLYTSLDRLDAPRDLAHKMNDIFGWDIDFKRDLRRGDTFRILYEEVWRDGQLVRTGAIEALEIVNRGKVKRAFRFTGQDDHPGYFDPDGRNMQKQLMRAPLEYSRISSNFSHRRFHPVLKKWMPHLGVDYAAPLGTPVRAGGDGVIVAATRKEGNGRYVHIRHSNSEYETYYLHLARFAQGVRPGARVSQGQVIGYVGATGYATGPHLDYRVKRNGKFVNPRELDLPAAHPVSRDMMPSFLTLADNYVATMGELALESSENMVPLAALAPPAWDGPTVVMAALPEWIRSAQ